MGSFATFFLAGLYPVPATEQFLLGSPYFPEISFMIPVLNKTTTIKANRFKGNPASGTGGNVFVEVRLARPSSGAITSFTCLQSVKIDGKPWKSNCFLDWSAFTSGSTIELQLTDNIDVSCGKSSDALPPSLSTGGYD